MIPHNRLVLLPEDHEAVARVMASGHIGQGPEVEAFERELAERFRPGGAAVCVSSGTAALYLAMKMTPHVADTISTYTCSAAYHAATLASHGRQPPPLLSDISPLTLHPLERHVSEHTYGLLDMKPSPIEDFTHAPMPPAGSIGDLSVASFGATKPLAAGAGGVVLGPTDVIEEIRDLRDYDGKRVMRARFNWALSDIHAALGRRKLARLADEMAWRNETAERYSEGLPPLTIRQRRARWHYRFALQADPATAIPKLAERGVEAINPMQPWELLHRKLWRSRSGYPEAERIAANTISVPIWPGMSRGEVEHVAEALKWLS